METLIELGHKHCSLREMFIGDGRPTHVHISDYNSACVAYFAMA